MSQLVVYYQAPKDRKLSVKLIVAGDRRLEEIGVTEQTALVAQEMLTMHAKKLLRNFEDDEGITTLYKLDDNLEGMPLELTLGESVEGNKSKDMAAESFHNKLNESQEESKDAKLVDTSAHAQAPSNASTQRSAA